MNDRESTTGQPEEDLVGYRESREHVERFAIKDMADTDLLLQLVPQD